MGAPNGAGDARRPSSGRRDSLLDLVVDAVLHLDASGRITLANRVAAELAASLGTGEVAGELFATVLPPLADGPVGEAVAAAASEGGWREAETWVPGLARCYLAHVAPVADGVGIRLQDVTVHRRTERADRIVQAVSDAVDEEPDPLGGLSAITRALRTATGGCYAEVLVDDPGRGGLQLISADHDDPVFAALADDVRARPLGPGSAPHRALAAGGPLRLRNLADPGAYPRSHLGAELNIRSGIFLPVAVRGAPDAVIAVYAQHDPDADDWWEVLREAAPRIVDAIAGARERHDLGRMFELSDSLQLISAMDGRMRRVNAAVSRLLDRPVRALEGASLVSLLHRDDVPAARRALRQLVAGEVVGDLQLRIQAGDGTFREVSWTVTLRSQEDVFFAVGRDVTERNRDAALQAARHEVLREVALGAPLAGTLRKLAVAVEARFPTLTVMIHQLDAGSSVLELVAAPSFAPGLQACHDLLGVDAETLTPAQAAAHAQERFTARLTPAGGWVAADELAALGRSACWSWPLLDQAGAVVGVFSCLGDGDELADPQRRSDLTDLAHLAALAVIRHEIEGRLLASERQLRLVALATSDAVWDWDLGADQLVWDETVRERFGHAPDEIGPDSNGWVEQIHPKDTDRVLRNLRSALDGDAQTWAERYRLRRGDGSYAHVLDRGWIVRDRQGRALRLVGGVVDETERHELEQQHLRTQRLESIGAVAGGVAHDLNNVLAPIQMGADLLAGQSLSEEQQQLVTTIADGARRGAALVRQVLAFARGVGSEQEALAPGTVLADVERLIRETFPATIDLSIDAPAQLPTITADPVQLQQVLLNLAINARDAMPDGGKLEIRVDVIEVDEPSRREVRPGMHVRFTVSDDGSGIPEEVRDRVFEPFFTTKDGGEGTGLGLAMVERIVTAHQGFVHLETPARGGTRIEVHIPVRAADVGAVAPPATSRASVAADGQLILVVDDEAPVRLMTGRSLETAGYQVVTAADGSELLTVAEERDQELALILVDMTMPVMDGAQAITALRDRGIGTPVILTSGIARGPGAGDDQLDVVDFLPKPYSAAQLHAAVSRALHGDA